MSTIGAVVDRVLQEHITPTTETPATCFVDSSVDDTTTSIDLDMSTLAVDERGAVQPSTILETLSGEMLFVKSVSISASTYTVTVARGWRGTTAAALTADDPVTISPPITRLSVFNAVADEVTALYPRLWGIETVAVTPDDTYVEVAAEAVSIEQFLYTNIAGRPRLDQVRIIRNFPDSGTGQAIVLDSLPVTGNAYVTYRTKFARPTAESDTLADLRVQDDWVSILVFGAAARAVTQLDPRSLSVEWVTELQQAEGAPPGTSTAVAQRLKRWRDQELEEASRRWRADHPTRVKITDPLRPWQGAG